MKTKKFGYLFASAALALTLAACGSDEESADKLNDGVIKVGVTAGLHEEITEVAAKIAQENGLTVEMEVFSDYVLPNTALVEGDLDVNNFQHEPYPVGFSSENYTSTHDAPGSAPVATPQVPTNGGRSLAVLAEAGYITLADGVGVNGTIYDIVENPKNFEFIELEAAQIPTQLGEVAVAAINTNFAMEAGLSPKTDSILLESADSPYVNVIVVRPGDEDSEDLKKCIESYQSDKVRQYI